MPRRAYYSVRTGKNGNLARLDLATVLRLFQSRYAEFEREGWFQESFGFICDDAGYQSGTLGPDVDGAILLALRKSGLWPIFERASKYSEEDFFDIIEFLHDHISKPTKRQWHSWNDCGWHCEEFERSAARDEFRAKMNEMLSEYGRGFELATTGEIQELPEAGMETLLEANLPDNADADVRRRVDAATAKFRRYRSSSDDRRDALRDLADVLEYLRPQVKAVLSSKDEDDLFNLANNFGIRHNNPKQKLNYERGVFYSWSFYYYLATIHACLHLLKRSPSDSLAT
jgi:hypothetical protein